MSTTEKPAAVTKPEAQVKASSKAPSKAPRKTAAVRKAVVTPAVPAPAVTATPAAPTKKKAASKAAAPKAKPAKAPKPAKVVKPKKQKMVRDSMTMPKDEYAVLDVLKARATKLTQPAKKTELLRAGIKALAAMSDAAFLAALKAVPSLKTGRPSKN